MSDRKKFDGKWYVFLYYRRTKAEARQSANNERLVGWKIRIVPRKIGNQTYYDVYGRNWK